MSLAKEYLPIRSTPLGSAGSFGDLSLWVSSGLGQTAHSKSGSGFVLRRTDTLASNGIRG
jgi:hypothetical protein